MIETQEVTLVETGPQAPEYEFLIVLGKNWIRKWQKPEGAAIPAWVATRPSMETRIGAIAAGLALESGLAKQVIFAGGMTGPVSEAEAMKVELERRYKGISNEQILLEGESLDTVQNARNIKKMLEEKGIDPQRCALATIGFHASRAEEIFKRTGLEFGHVFNTEDIIGDKITDPQGHFQSFFERYQKSPRVALEQIREGVAMGLLQVDTRGQIPEFFAKIFRRYRHPV